MSSEKSRGDELFSRAFKMACEKTGLTQTALAKVMGRGTSTVNDSASGRKKPSFDRVCEIAGAFGMDVVEFLAMGRAVELWAEGRVPEAAKKLVPNPEAAQAAAQKIVAETAAGSVDELKDKYYKALEQIAAQAAELSALRAELDALKQEGGARAPLSVPAPASVSGSENAA